MASSPSASAARSVRTVDLTPREYELIAFLASSPRVAYGKDTIVERVFRSSREWQDPDTVTEHIYRLRRELKTPGHEWVTS